MRRAVRLFHQYAALLHFREFYERFLLPFLPLAMIVLLDLSRGIRPSLPAAALVVSGAMLLFSLALAATPPDE